MFILRYFPSFSSNYLVINKRRHFLWVHNSEIVINIFLVKWSLLFFLFPFVEILSAFRNATQCATKWAKAWHTWALFNTAVMSHYTVRGFPNKASQFVVAAVNGYFHSIACAANTKGVDDSLQVCWLDKGLFQNCEYTITFLGLIIAQIL